MWDIGPKMTRLLKNTFYDFEYVTFLFPLWKSPLWASVLHFLVQFGEGQALFENVMDLVNQIRHGGWPYLTHLLSSQRFEKFSSRDYNSPFKMFNISLFRKLAHSQRAMLKMVKTRVTRGIYLKYVKQHACFVQSCDRPG